MGYDDLLIKVEKTEEYARWFASLRDRRVRVRIGMRIYRLQQADIRRARVLATQI